MVRKLTTMWSVLAALLLTMVLGTIQTNAAPVDGIGGIQQRVCSNRARRKPC